MLTRKRIKMKKQVCLLTFLLVSLLFAGGYTTGLMLDESPATEREWGYRPSEGMISAVNPPSFCWRPQKDIINWEFECAITPDFSTIEYRSSGIAMNVHGPPRILPAGRYFWRYRGQDQAGQFTSWSQTRDFTLPDDATHMPLPSRQDLLARIPSAHPRLFVRPEELPELRELAKGDRKPQYDQLIATCDQLLANPPSTAEPFLYPETMQRYGYEWTLQWWGNRLHVIKALDGAAMLGFTYQLSGKREYGDLAKKLLLECARWDPFGASGYRYNDEAGMPYTCYFARAYTYIHELLSEEERAVCRNVAAVRGKQMYEHLYPRQLWDAFVSHNARAWHFLGELGIAFAGEVEGADEWVWFAMNLTYNVYPIWSDEDGGWHEGFSYWHSYIGRFKWWGLAVRSAMDLNVFAKPYFYQAGYFAMYHMPPGRDAAEFGDGSVRIKETNLVPLFGEGSFLREQAVNAVPLMSRLAAETGNGYWQWYVEQMGGPVEEPGYIGFAHPLPRNVKAVEPDDLPTSRLFRGTGLACLNTTLRDAREDVQVLFKASQMGTQSHGIESSNSFALWAYGERLLIRTGHYYMYGAPHHADWVWETKSQNNITVNGHGQVKHSPFSKGKIAAFKTAPRIDAVVGEAGEAYRIGGGDAEHRLLDRFTRAILFVKPELIIVYDRLEAREPSTFAYHLHALNQFQMAGQQKIRCVSGDVSCDILMLAPQNLILSQTDQYDPNPWPQITFRDWHLTAVTDTKSLKKEFITLYRPHRGVQSAPKAELSERDGGYVLKVGLGDESVVALLPSADKAGLAGEGLTSCGEIVVQYRTGKGRAVETVRLAANE